MVIMIICLILAFAWLGYESDWMRVRLMVGKPQDSKRPWQFLKYGDDCIIMKRNSCYGINCNLCYKLGEDRFWGWRIPARTVTLYGSTINFKEGCNLYRAKLLRDIVKAQKSKAQPAYKPTGYHTNEDYYTSLYGDPSIELLIDGKVKANINGDYKRGMIKEVLKPYTTKARVGKRVVTWGFGEADSQAVKVSVASSI